jgi:hypothetical protein
MSRNGLVKITLEGLLLLSFRSCPTGTRCQAGVLVTEFNHGEEHELKIEVKGPGVSGYFTYSHKQVLDKAPFWLYVGNKCGDLPDVYTAEPYKMDDPCDPKSFYRVLDMEDFHRPSCIKITSEMPPTLNIPQGVFHSKKVKKMKCKLLDGSGTYQYKKMATKTCAEIDLEKVGIDKPHLILWSKKKKDSLFRISLEAGASYKVSVKNAPIVNSYAHHPSNHFHYYYKVFNVQPPKQYEVDVSRTDDAPPCISVRLNDNSLPD